jgi:thioredoxin reductase/SAM-dependent methyltransferase
MATNTAEHVRSHPHDVIVIGGGAAGLSAAILLSRARRSVLVIDAGDPRNAPADGVHNLLAREGTPPLQLLAIGREEVARYGGHVISGRAAEVDRDGKAFVVTLEDGSCERARRVLVTTGLVDELPDIPGVRERWGHDVLHCPYCHGWEFRDQPLGVIALGPHSAHQALLFTQWTSDLIFFTHTAGGLDESELEKLAARGVRIVAGKVTGLEIADDRLAGVRLASGEVIARAAVAIGPRFSARSALLTGLGLLPEGLAVNGHTVATRIAADPTGRTSVPGVWVAGNVTDPMAQVAAAAADGSRAAQAINVDLLDEDVAVALALHRGGEEFWEERYQSQQAIWSGQPNPQLIAEAADLPAGRALDVGAGEGADSVWLAQRGWQVDGVDISRTALERAAQHAHEAGVHARTTWVAADVTDWEPEAGAYDLVTAQYMHLPREQRRTLFARLANAVAPGGRLLIVGHDPSDMQTSVPRPRMPHMFYTAAEVASDLDPQTWDVLAAERRPRETVDPAHQHVMIADAVLLARRRPRLDAS